MTTQLKTLLEVDTKKYDVSIKFNIEQSKKEYDKHLQSLTEQIKESVQSELITNITKNLNGKHMYDYSEIKEITEPYILLINPSEYEEQTIKNFKQRVENEFIIMELKLVKPIRGDFY